MVQKKVYFVRHGEAESNVAASVQGSDTSDPLTERGSAQALRLAERAQHLDFDTLISSDLERAKQTAEAISEATGKPVEHSALFREKEMPTVLAGKSGTDEKVQEFIAAAQEHFADPDWRYDDDESFNDFVERVHKGLAFLETHESDSILVVSHGHFIRTVVFSILFGELLTAEVWSERLQRLLTTNTGITECRLGEGGWYLMTWNDRAHFAE